jgi:hypothetical protein
MYEEAPAAGCLNSYAPANRRWAGARASSPGRRLQLKPGNFRPLLLAPWPQRADSHLDAPHAPSPIHPSADPHWANSLSLSIYLLAENANVCVSVRWLQLCYVRALVMLELGVEARGEFVGALNMREAPLKSLRCLPPPPHCCNDIIMRTLARQYFPHLH